VPANERVRKVAKKHKAISKSREKGKTGEKKLGGKEKKKTIKKRESKTLPKVR